MKICQMHSAHAEFQQHGASSEQFREWRYEKDFAIRTCLSSYELIHERERYDYGGFDESHELAKSTNEMSVE